MPCHCHALRHATRVLTHHYDVALAPSGLTTPQFAMLRTIQRLGATNITDIARRMGLDRTTLGRNLKPLIEAGLLIRSEDERDGRERIIRLTDKGHDCVQHALPLWKRTQDGLARRLGRDKLEQLRNLLSDLETAAQA